MRESGGGTEEAKAARCPVDYHNLEERFQWGEMDRKQGWIAAKFCYMIPIIHQARWQRDR